MLKNSKPNFSYIIPLVLTSLIHILILLFVKRNSGLNWSPSSMSEDRFFKKLKINKIELINQEQLENFKRVGIKGGKKDQYRPDMLPMPQFPSTKAQNSANLSISQLGLSKNNVVPTNAKNIEKPVQKPTLSNLSEMTPSNTGDIYFNYKKQKTIPQSREHNAIKNEAVKNLGLDRMNTKANNISNFDVRIERPEGVTEDKLNSDEKAFYSFYKRTYMNYISKLYSTYNDVRVTNPGIDQDFEDQHLLIGKIDYDENGNIITIKILKSSRSDNVHHFFEEALKKLIIPNPPKIFSKKQKQFSVYYQIHIN